MNRSLLKRRLVEYCRIHPEGITISELARYYINLDCEKRVGTFDDLVFDLIAEGSIYQSGVLLFALDSMEEISFGEKTNMGRDALE